MTGASSLGSLTKLDVREVWANEAIDFTPWLAEEENIALLNAALGLELEVESTEVAAGPYSADILARDSASSAFVVIENQLGKTDHDHLGKAITYAAVLDAETIVWVAPEFTGEHRKAIDWLNDNSSGDVAFYGVQLELWRVDESRPAVRFNVLARPADSEIKAAVAKATGQLSETRELQLEWWKAFSEQLTKSGAITSARKARPQYWFTVPLGRSGIVLSNVADTYGNRIGVRVYLRHKYGGDAALEQLALQKDAIEAEIGMKLQWNPNPENKDKTIAIYHDADLTDRDSWPEWLSWMVDTTSKFRSAIAPRIRSMDLSRTVDSDEESSE